MERLPTDLMVYRPFLEGGKGGGLPMIRFLLDEKVSRRV